MSRAAGLFRRRGLRVAVLVAACVGLGLTAVNATEDGLTYYRTPTEIRQEAPTGGLVRVGGLVAPGSMRQSTEVSTVVLTDGATDVAVSYPGRLPAVIQEGQGAVVEGRFDSAGVLRAEELLMRHSNEYRAPEAGTP